ncbi:3 beta-hydroxysteroid dehydrogenase/Delta 5--_4-isomerase type 2 [Arctopsyche grandis]|uniref:3 beta-hydroxysteroid dehydrogenase/Delta 5-->4-isomerase type 2 n=1 Tax=Arctopsyche grandis TaxID=121162 RepID=UPI00406D7089
MSENKSIVLITGGAGFLGQHLVKELQACQDTISEIRILDLKPYFKLIDHDQPIPVNSILGNILDKDTIRHAFEDVKCVFHCAAYVSYTYPPNYSKLNKVNVEGSENVISLCQEFDVEKLVFTSTAEVSMIPYIWKICLAVIINQTEKKALPPVDSDKFVIPGYPESKLKAEMVVLGANGSLTKNGKTLKTVALRPSFIYGEEDPRFMTSIINVAQKMGGRVPKLAGAGGKQQVVYAGNVAWAHICAMKTLGKENEEISGFPAFITDDSPVEDATRTCERLTREDDDKVLCKTNWWYIPMVVSFLIAMVLQAFSSVTSIRLPVSPCALISYLSSFIYFSRLRASIHMEYSPKYDEEESVGRSSVFYKQYYKSLCKEALSNKNDDE